MVLFKYQPLLQHILSTLDEIWNDEKLLHNVLHSSFSSILTSLLEKHHHSIKLLSPCFSVEMVFTMCHSKKYPNGLILKFITVECFASRVVRVIGDDCFWQTVSTVSCYLWEWLTTPMFIKCLYGCFSLKELWVWFIDQFKCLSLITRKCVGGSKQRIMESFYPSLRSMDNS